ncbi:hypothetical protein M405DRAFT_541519 [Rhizopogon salebrosus TDB-379]|nr:hypothetical protein M405DRAFT_541519 [Rhizopogon salebrosus TDB-379]
MDQCYQHSATPTGANTSFDALIDVLASDDIHDVAVSPSGPSLYSPRHTVHLRDASGKLDFDKIRLMLLKHNRHSINTQQFTCAV